MGGSSIRKDLERMREHSTGRRAPSGQTSEAAIRLKKDQKMVQLSEERDWFRAEALKLNTKAKSQDKTIANLKERLSVTLEERDLFLAQLYEEKAETRKLRKEINNMKLK